VYRAFFDREADRLAAACQEMSERFLAGGRLLAFGRGPYATDAQNVSVEFVHPVIVGKRALPALDLSLMPGEWIEAILRPEDMVMGFGPPEGDSEAEALLDAARKRGAMTFYVFRTATQDPLLHQEMIEILYHTLWETVHVFFARRELAHDAGDAAFLYPFLGSEKQDTSGVLDEVAASIRAKVGDDARLREAVAQEQADANDWALDCVLGRIPAVSLALEPANITALANDIGSDAIFARQLIAHARPEDVAVGISTSGGSRNIVMALEEARKRNLLTVALLGYDGGEIMRRGLADHPIVVRSDYIPRIQEVQASIYHIIWSFFVKTELFGTAACPHTDEMRGWLEWNRREYVEYDVEKDPEALKRMFAVTGGQSIVPVLLEDGKVAQIGWQGRGCVVSRPPHA
jgi:D-sedoheptulose 7-phosphate isomerase